MSKKEGVGAVVAALLFVAQSAVAHPGPGISGEHTSMEHFVAMLALGLWAVVLGGAAVYFGGRLTGRFARKSKQ